MSTRRRRSAGIVVAMMAIFAIVAWVAGFLSALVLSPTGIAVPDNVHAPANFGLYNEAWGIVSSEYYGQRPAGQAVADNAIEGMVAALGDPYAAYLDDESANQTERGFQPGFVASFGAWIEPVMDGALVVATLPGSPAETSGILPGDTILAVGETELVGVDREAVLKALGEHKEEKAGLVVAGPDEGPRPVELLPRAVDAPQNELSRPEPEVAYLRLADLTPSALQELDRALESFRADPPTTLLLDLRNNPGGDQATLLAIAGRFMRGPVWVEVDHAGHETPHLAEAQGGPAVGRPGQLIVLVNRGTASTAEMLAGALHDAAGAKVIGQPTFGRGTIQALTNLSNQSQLRLTVAHWHTPKGTDVDEIGLAPDVAIELTAEDRAAGRDPQLDAALDAASETITERHTTGG